MVYPNVVTHVAPNAQQITPHPPRIVYLSTLKRHTAAVNVVRWSPNGQILASAGDGEVTWFSHLSFDTDWSLFRWSDYTLGSV